MERGRTEVGGGGTRMELVSWQKVSGTGRDSSPSQASWSNLKKKKKALVATHF